MNEIIDSRSYFIQRDVDAQVHTLKPFLGVIADKYGELKAYVQAEREAGPLTAEESVGTWFSNPAANHGSQQQHGGVGKYLKAPLAAKAAPVAGASADLAAAPPPAKKPKQAAGGYGNFGSW